MLAEQKYQLVTVLGLLRSELPHRLGLRCSHQRLRKLTKADGAGGTQCQRPPVADFTAEIFGKCSPGGVNSILRALRALLGFAVEQGLLEKPPVVEMVEEPNPDEELQFVSAAETDSFLSAVLDFEPEWHAFFVVAFRTGLRIGELIELRWKDVKLEPTFLLRPASPATSRSTREAQAGTAEAQGGRKVLQFLGRPTGIEPVTPGATVRCSTN